MLFVYKEAPPGRWVLSGGDMPGGWKCTWVPGSLGRSRRCCLQLPAQLLTFRSSEFVPEEMELIISTSLFQEGRDHVGRGLQSPVPGTQALNMWWVVWKLVSKTHRNSQIFSHSLQDLFWPSHPA